VKKDEDPERGKETAMERELGNKQFEIRPRDDWSKKRSPNYQTSQKSKRRQNQYLPRERGLISSSNPGKGKKTYKNPSSL